MKNHSDVIVVGAGAAGLMSAWKAASRGRSVLILEKNPKPGLKILISGGGRCNFTNLEVSSKHYVSENVHFCKSALKQFTNWDFIDLVVQANIPYYEKTLGQLFCKRSSKDILNLLLSLCETRRVMMKTSITIEKIHKTDKGFEIICGNQSFTCHSLIITTGGLSYAKLGASDFGYQVAKQFGHNVISCLPALDGYVWPTEKQKRFSELSGISLLATLTTKNVALTEALLFTHHGLSGPVALKSSLYWQPNQKVFIHFLPHENLTDIIQESRDKNGKGKIKNTLSKFLPERFVVVSLSQLDLIDTNWASLSKSKETELFHFFTAFEFTPTSTVGYEKAEVTKGGVSVDEISSKTMESKLCPGLYFAGEVLDVTGLLGGYNFQWAWSSGFVAGLNA